MSDNKRNEIARVKGDANEAKNRLMSIVYDLRDLGAIREANSLETIIAKLEAWRNK